MASCRIQESKEARRSINCMFLGWMMICGMYCMLLYCSANLELLIQRIENDAKIQYNGYNKAANFVFGIL